jgi:uncharacterized protein with GYD domain
MPHYLIQAGYKESAVKAMIANPADRTEIVRKAVESAGGKLHSFFLAFGEYDVVAIVELPDNQSAAALGLGLVSGGALSRHHTTVLMSPAEAAEAMRKAQTLTYTPPR